jgi:hypothetical protein
MSRNKICGPPGRNPSAPDTQNCVARGMIVAAYRDESLWCWRDMLQDTQGFRDKTRSGVARECVIRYSQTAT